MTNSRALASVTVATMLLLGACLDWTVGPRASANGDGGPSTQPPPTGDDGGAAPVEGLLAHWKFDDGAGSTAIDASGQGHNAILVGGASWTTGKYGGGIVFTADGQYVEAVSLEGSAFPAQQGTLSFWVNSAFPGDFRPLFDGLGPNRRHLSLRNSIAGRLQFNGVVGDGTFAFTGAFDVPADTWLHVVLVWDLQARKVAAYRDGALAFSADDVAAGWLPDGQETSFANRGGGSAFVGTIDEARLYGRALSPAEIQRVP